MRSRKKRAGSPLAWLLRKEWRELLVSRAWWVLLLGMGPLVGISFISAVRTYGEVSGLNGGAAGVGEALDPLTGIWAPAFSACELAAVFLLPFVAIRLAGGDRQSGALHLEMQRGMSPFIRIGAKAAVLLMGWLVAMLPPASAMLLWKSYGGTVYLPELAGLAAGHLLNAALTIGLAAAMAAMAEHPSTAAILTLGVTVGTWILNFFGAIQGGWWERAAAYTPAAMVAEFQHGLLRLDTMLVAVILVCAGLAFAATWIRLGIPVRRRVYESAALCVAVALLIFAATLATPSWDASESRANSFPEADEEALRSIHGPLTVEAHLAQEDPRRIDLERHALSKLRRVLPHVKVRYISATSIGLFEQASAGYGEIWYDLGGRKTMSRVTTAEGVLESIYSLAGIAPPAENDAAVFRGHPLATTAAGAGYVFYLGWPAAFAVAAIAAKRGLRTN